MVSATVGPAASRRFSTRRCGHAVGDVVDRTVPAVDRAVVELELVEGRGAAGLEHLERVLLVGDGQQRREVADVLLEEVEHRGDPPLAEPHPRPDALGLELLAAGVGRLLEQRDAGLAPQLLAEQVGRVRRHRQLHAGDRLGGVPVGGELVGRGLHVELRAGAGGLRDDRVRRRGEPLLAGDADRDVLAARGEDLLGQQLVARVGAERVERSCAPRPASGGSRSSPGGRRPWRPSPRRR